MFCGSSTSRRQWPTWEALLAQQASLSRSGIRLQGLAPYLQPSPGQGQMAWTIWLPVARAGMEATLTLAIRRCSSKASTTRQSLALVSPKSTSRFELRENFTTLNLLSVVHSKVSWMRQEYYSPRVLLCWLTWVVRPSVNFDRLCGVKRQHGICSSKKNAQSVTEHCKFSVAISCASVNLIDSLALWLFEILQICVLRLELFCSATKLAPLPRVQCRHAWLLWHLLISLPIRIPKARLKNQIRSGWRSRPAYCLLLVLFAF